MDKQQRKKIEREEERLKNNNRDMSFVKMKSMLAIGFVFTALLGMFNSMYVQLLVLSFHMSVDYYILCLSNVFHLYRFDGRVVAFLPFQPISLVQNLTHRNLPGEDFTECSFIFLYILSTMSIRQVSKVYDLFAVYYS